MTDMKLKMWKAIAEKPVVMLGLSEDQGHFEPMMAQLDESANGAFWFFTRDDNRAAMGGPASVTFVAQDHTLFASLRGSLVREKDQDVIDKHWSNDVAAWFEKGREDPHMVMLRFELVDAEIWAMEASGMEKLKFSMGEKVSPTELGEHDVVDLTDG